MRDALLRVVSLLLATVVVAVFAASVTFAYRAIDRMLNPSVALVLPQNAPRCP